MGNTGSHPCTIFAKFGDRRLAVRYITEEVLPARSWLFDFGWICLVHRDDEKIVPAHAVRGGCDKTNPVDLVLHVVKEA